MHKNRIILLFTVAFTVRMRWRSHLEHTDPSCIRVQLRYNRNFWSRMSTRGLRVADISNYNWVVWKRHFVRRRWVHDLNTSESEIVNPYLYISPCTYSAYSWSVDISWRHKRKEKKNKKINCIYFSY
jgi:hypothetical protein